MYNCSECGRGIGRFDQKNPPVCPNGRTVRVAQPTVLSTRSTEVRNAAPTGASPSFQGDTEPD